MCWSKKEHRKEIIRKGWAGLKGLENQDLRERKHPTQKPVEVFEFFIKKFSKENDIIWDGYLGSGSTLIACEKTGRICYGMEIAPYYCDLIIQRWERYTGLDAVREDGEKYKELIP